MLYVTTQALTQYSHVYCDDVVSYLNAQQQDKISVRELVDKFGVKTAAQALSHVPELVPSLRLFAAWCVAQYVDLSDEDLAHSVELVTQYACGLASVQELEHARQCVWRNLQEHKRALRLAVHCAANPGAAPDTMLPVHRYMPNISSVRYWLSHAAASSVEPSQRRAARRSVKLLIDNEFRRRYVDGVDPAAQLCKAPLQRNSQWPRARTATGEMVPYHSELVD